MEYLVFSVMVLSMAGFVYFYLKSVQPAQMEKDTGKGAYSKCAKFRYVAYIFTLMYLVALLGYRFFPLFSNIPLFFSSSWLYLLIPALLLAIPASILKSKASVAAGKSFAPNKSTPMYKGIYETIRHPQAVGDILYYISMGFFLNSPFLLLFNLLWIPIYIYLSYKEEKDLLLRYGERYKEYIKHTGFMIPKKKAI